MINNLGKCDATKVNHEIWNKISELPNSDKIELIAHGHGLSVNFGMRKEMPQSKGCRVKADFRGEDTSQNNVKRSDVLDDEVNREDCAIQNQIDVDSNKQKREDCLCKSLNEDIPFELSEPDVLVDPTDQLFNYAKKTAPSGGPVLPMNRRDQGRLAGWLSVYNSKTIRENRGRYCKIVNHLLTASKLVIRIRDGRLCRLRLTKNCVNGTIQFRSLDKGKAFGSLNSEKEIQIVQLPDGHRQRESGIYIARDAINKYTERNLKSTNPECILEDAISLCGRIVSQNPEMQYKIISAFGDMVLGEYGLVSDASRLLKIPYPTLVKAVTSGRLAVHKLGGGRRVVALREVSNGWGNNSM